MKLSLLYQDQGSAIGARADNHRCDASRPESAALRCPTPGASLPPPAERPTDDRSRHLHQWRALDRTEGAAVKLSLAIAAIVLGAAIAILAVENFAAGPMGESYAGALSQ